MTRLLLTIFSLFVLSLNAPAQTPSDPDQATRLTKDATGNSFTYSWWGMAGRTYFIQHSDDLIQWAYVPMVEQGADQVIQWGFTSTADKFFVRLERQSDGNLLPDSWLLRYFGSTASVDPNAESPGDTGSGKGWTLWDDFINGTDPNKTDADGDGVADAYQDKYPLDPRRSRDVPVANYAAIRVASDESTASNGFALGDAGQYSYWYLTPEGDYHVVYWNQGEITEGTMPGQSGTGGAVGAPVGISADGVLAGADYLWSVGSQNRLKFASVSDGGSIDAVVNTGQCVGISGGSVPWGEGVERQFEFPCRSDLRVVIKDIHYIGGEEFPRVTCETDYTKQQATFHCERGSFEPQAVSYDGSKAAGIYAPPGPDVVIDLSGTGVTEIGSMVDNSKKSFKVWMGGDTFSSAFPGHDIDLETNAIATDNNGTTVGTSPYVTPYTGSSYSGPETAAPADAKHLFVMQNGGSAVDIYSLIPADLVEQVSFQGAITGSPAQGKILADANLLEGKEGEWNARKVVVDIAAPIVTVAETKSINPTQINDASWLGANKPAVLLPFEVSPNPLPTTGTVRAKVVYGPGFVVPEDVSGISIKIGGEEASNIYQDPSDPHIIYFTPPPAPGQQAGDYDIEISGITIEGLPVDPATGIFKLEKYVKYTADAEKGVEGFSKAIAVGIEEAKAVAMFRQAENDLTDAQTAELYTALRQWQANPGIEMLQTFLADKTKTAAVEAALESMVAQNDRQSTSVLLALGYTDGEPIAAAASTEPSQTYAAAPAAAAPNEEASPTVTPVLGSANFFADVKQWMTETSQKVFTGTFGHVNFAVINADEFVLDTYTVNVAGKTIDDVKVANPSAEIIVNGALCNLFCDLLERTTKYRPRPAAPLVTTGIVLKGGTYLPTSATPESPSYYTGGLRYWFGQLYDTSPAQNAGAALSYRFGKGHPPVTTGPLGPTNIDVAVGGLISLIWQDGYGTPRKKQTVKTDADLGGYEAFTDEVNGFNIIGVDREAGMLIIAGKPDQKRQRLFDDSRNDDIQDKLFDSGVEQAVVSDGGGSAAYYVKGKFDHKGYRHRPPGILQNLTGGVEYNTVTNYLIFRLRPSN